MYEDLLWYDVIPMKVTYILLGWLLLYERELHRAGKTNTQSSIFNTCQMVLWTMIFDEAIERKTIATPKFDVLPIWKLSTENEDVSNISDQVMQKEDEKSKHGDITQHKEVPNIEDALLEVSYVQ